MPAATIIINDKASAQSNSFGFFTLTQKSAEEIVLKVTYSGYLPFQKNITGGNPQNLIIRLVVHTNIKGGLGIFAATNKVHKKVEQ